ncbi:hypothetical protein KJ762_03295 [bacterium]|nr:hypothetical protein [bacterium]MBU1065719.1 hypothetical protein [bacterium]MBU1633518.1 hypothetical protein [bacterium]MBU1874980.1 hypothetical protein [bacterium]
MKSLSKVFGIVLITLFLIVQVNDVAYAGNKKKKCAERCETSCVEKSEKHTKRSKKHQCTDQCDHEKKTEKSEKAEEPKTK